MQYTRKFQDITKKEYSLAGGKGASLAQMAQAGIPVPPGFIILATAFDDFLRKSGMQKDIESILRSVQKNKMQSIEKASEKVRARVLHTTLPSSLQKEVLSAFATLGAQYVAVRSSATAEDGATAAWAGQLETFLNTTQKNLLENVLRCWASLFSPRAIFYRLEKGFSKQHIAVAVVVQKMIESEVAGIAFSVHPVTQNRNQLILEAALGLGEAVVSGQITPDSYVVGKKEKKILETYIAEQKKMLVRAAPQGTVWRKVNTASGKKQKLSNKEVLELAQLVSRIEQHYGFPVDVEWAIEKKKLFITQSRPITTLS